MPPRVSLEELVLPGCGRQPNLRDLLEGITTRDPAWRCPLPAAAPKPQPARRERHATFRALSLDVTDDGDGGSDPPGSTRMPDGNTPHPLLAAQRSSRRSMFRARSGDGARARSGDGAADSPRQGDDRARRSTITAKSSRRLRRHLAAVEAAQRMQIANVSSPGWPQRNMPLAGRFQAATGAPSAVTDALPLPAWVRRRVSSSA